MSIVIFTILHLQNNFKKISYYSNYKSRRIKLRKRNHFSPQQIPKCLQKQIKTLYSRNLCYRYEHFRYCF